MIEQVEELTERHERQLHALYQHEWWSQDREFADVVRMLAATDLTLGLVDRQTDELIGFCRVLTDFVYHATIYDVIVHADHRKTGLGRRLIEAVLGHPRIAPVIGVWLCCLDEMVPFYAKLGFAPSGESLRWMVRLRTEA